MAIGHAGEVPAAKPHPPAGAFANSDASVRRRLVLEKDCRRAVSLADLSPAAPLDSMNLVPMPEVGQLDSDGVLNPEALQEFVAAVAPMAKKVTSDASRKASTTFKYGGSVGLFHRFLVLNNCGRWFEEVKDGEGRWQPRKRASGELLVVPPELLTYYLLACATGGHTMTSAGAVELTGASRWQCRGRYVAGARLLSLRSQLLRTVTSSTAAGLG